MKRKLFFSAVAIALLLGAAVLPMAFTDRSHTPLIGPDLQSLQFQDVSFTNGGLQLAGMMFLPESDGPFPVAVIIHGSGPSRRDSTWYLSVAENLQKNGVAVLLPDKRGCEKSQGNWIGADFEELATDTAAAVDFIRQHETLDHSEVGLIGMSQGGWIAPVVAAQNPDIEFVVSMSGSTVTTDQQLYFEEVNNISAYTWPLIARILAPTTTKRIRQMDHFKPFSAFDPIPYWREVDARVFFAFGENDLNVPVDDSIARLDEDLGISSFRVYPGGGHAIRDPQTNTVQGEFLGDLVVFIKQD